MQIHTKEHADMIKDFEGKFPGRHDKEPKELWPRGVIFQDGLMNQLFLAYRAGYSTARCEYLIS